MICRVVSPLKESFVKDVVAVTLPTITGIAEVKRGHAEYFTSLVPGVVVCQLENGSREEIEVAEAVCWVYHDEVKIVM
ncbi:hypothetical protein KC902_01515 [Candidatus Kaiserbacteria bacterium]|nr:hypothetical protein [Candidatus Kaiserbacteria bacterium]USN88711.1 MAG: hypothetical protein H6780_04465 [Candidatus Nomurabacteria bacterium]